MSILRCKVRLVRHCQGCGLVHMIEAEIAPKEIENEEAILRMFRYAKNELDQAPCPECEKMSPVSVIGLRSADGKGTEWGV